LLTIRQNIQQRLHDKDWTILKAYFEPCAALHKFSKEKLR